MHPVPTRQIYWNIVGWQWMYVALIPLVAVFALGVARRAISWRRGRPDAPRGDWRRLVRFALLQGNVLRERDGWNHVLFYVSFLVLAGGTTVVFIDKDLGIPIMRGWFYLIYQSLLLDLAGLAAIVAAAVFLWRREVRRLPRLQKPEHLETRGADRFILWGFILICVTGFLLQALRIRATADPWGAWSPVGYALSFLFPDAAFDRAVQPYLWWFHLGVAFAWMAAIPWTKMAHVFLGAANVYYAERAPRLATPDLEDPALERLGVASAGDLTWKGLLDLDACTECGRCQDACPANAVGQPLSPKQLILDLRRAGDAPLVRGAIGDETLWSCTTCRACVEVCPVGIEPFPKIVDMRRNLVMEVAEFPEGMAGAVESIETRGHPWRGAGGARADWAGGLGVRVLGAGESCDLLYWVGCTAAFDPRNQRVARAVARLLQYAGVDFAILGEAESCTGDPARRIGHEYLYQMQARQNVETLAGRRFNRVVTACPHCFNTLRNEYPDFGGDYVVVHHSQLLQQLVDDGRLPRVPRLAPAGAGAGARVTYHDPCYLGRYNGEYDAPRAGLAAAGLSVSEMPRSRERSFCCGAGGGRVFADGGRGARINQERGRQARATGAATVATACPFCMLMMEDGARAAAGDGTPQRVRDVAELLAAAVFGEEVE